MPQPFHTNILEATLANDTFRTVIFTGAQQQVVVMCIPPGGEIGSEVHDHVEQFFAIVSGSGEAELNADHQALAEGDILVVTPGTQHNIRNTGSEALKLYTVYAPPNHIDGRIHATKAEADADTADEAFGHQVK